MVRGTTTWSFTASAWEEVTCFLKGTEYTLVLVRKWIFFRGSVFCLPDDVFVFFVLAFTLLESSVHHTGVHIGRAAKGQREMKYDPNSISHWTSDKCSAANNNNVPSSDLPHISPESVGLIEEADHAEEDGPHVLGGVPSLTGQLPRLGVIHGWVEDGDTEVTVLVNIWVPHFWLES